MSIKNKNSKVSYTYIKIVLYHNKSYVLLNQQLGKRNLTSPN